MLKFEEGQWVQGRTAEGGLIHGYVDSVDRWERIVKIHVVNSDQVDMIGKRVAVRESWLKPLPASKLGAEGEVRSVIDLALSTRDRDWFMELSSLLEGSGGREPDRKAPPAASSSPESTTLTR
ncbi:MULTISPECIES: hypothetical protein [Paenibacillus]|uniref:hypothetical protein n=1 Tax=Paenibacillus TaxID=44249 RepID=UPI0022B8F3AE|nr:hypothetical protein [Paenibacillus caseinilyticus]MCZ8522654.1 hypothetical protein [Paenibacillus caseinilyticus]